MKPIIIETKNLSKKYIISHEVAGGRSTLVETLARALTRTVQKSAANEEFWALKGVSFTIEEGDRLGIVGKNGAGKSTLLKLLSRIADPTGGQIKIRGRVSSLLEVGTGFHPELTGRENIFLNGAILGMSSKEIKKRFDEIVAFADVEKFLDTPVKRYSSGMFARLGFAIAAHLDPDLLIVDEVLAVGDQQFQEKCLKKLGQLGQVGRTVLFVSHDIGNVLALCNKGLWLERGESRFFGAAASCVSEYMKSFKGSPIAWSGAHGDEHIQFTRFALRGNTENEFFTSQDRPQLEIEYEVFKTDPDLLYGFSIYNSRNQLIARAHTADDPGTMSRYSAVGKHKIAYPLPAHLFNEGEYTLQLECVIHNKKPIIVDEISLRFPVYSPHKNTRYNHLHERGGLFLGNHFTPQI